MVTCVEVQAIPSDGGSEFLKESASSRAHLGGLVGFFGSGDIFGYTGRGVLMRRRVFVPPFAPSPFSTGGFAFGAAFGGGDFRDDLRWPRLFCRRSGRGPRLLPRRPTP